MIVNIFFIVSLWLLEEGRDLCVALYVIPFSLFFSYMLRPAMLYINVRRRLVMGGGICLPFSCFKIEIDHTQDNGHWRVYLKGTNPLPNTSKWQSGMWETLAWVSATETEATKVAEEFRLNGIGMETAEGHDRVIKVIKADKRIRMLVFLAYFVSVLVLAVWMLPWSESKLEQVEKPEVLLRIIRIVIAFIFLSIVPFGVYLCLFGWRVIKHREMPPPGTKVIVDTKVLEGDKAVTRGRLVITVALVLIVLGLFGGLYFPYKLGKVFGEQIRQTAPQAASEN